MADRDGLAGESCAHLRVVWRTRPLTNGALEGWWECEFACGARFAPMAFYETTTTAHERDIERLHALLKEVAAERLQHMNKWRGDRVELMRIAPGYTYRNRVDDPEWEIAKAAIIAALASASAPEVVSTDAPTEPPDGA